MADAAREMRKESRAVPARGPVALVMTTEWGPLALTPTAAGRLDPPRPGLEPAIRAVAPPALDRPGRRPRRRHQRLGPEPADHPPERRRRAPGDHRLAVAAAPARDHRPRLSRGGALAVRQLPQPRGPVGQRGARHADLDERLTRPELVPAPRHGGGS